MYHRLLLPNFEHYEKLLNWLGRGQQYQWRHQHVGLHVYQQPWQLVLPGFIDRLLISNQCCTASKQLRNMDVALSSLCLWYWECDGKTAVWLVSMILRVWWEDCYLTCIHHYSFTPGLCVCNIFSLPECFVVPSSMTFADFQACSEKFIGGNCPVSNVLWCCYFNTSMDVSKVVLYLKCILCVAMCWLNPKVS